MGDCIPEVETVVIKKQAPVCKRCYINFGQKKSPECDHVFCGACYEKCHQNAKDGATFTCFLCNKVDDAATSQGDDGDGTLLEEKLGKGVKKDMSFEMADCKEPVRLSMTKDLFAIADIDEGDVLIYDANGHKQRSFRYLLNHTFGGGFTMENNDVVLISLKNEKYSAISFYEPGGKFNFSAFAEKTADLPAIAVNSRNDIVAIDTQSNSILIINQEKCVHKLSKITPPEDFQKPLKLSSVAVTREDDIMVLDDASKSVLIYDSSCNFKRFVQLGGTKPRKSTDPIVKSGDASENNEASAVTIEDTTESQTMVDSVSKLTIDSNGCWLILDKSMNRVDLYSDSGQLGLTVVEFADAHLSLQDIALSGQDTLSVLLIHTITNKAFINVYNYSSPRHLRSIKSTPSSSKCCVIL